MIHSATKAVPKRALIPATKPTIVTPIARPVTDLGKMTVLHASVRPIEATKALRKVHANATVIRLEQAASSFVPKGVTPVMASIAMNV